MPVLDETGFTNVYDIDLTWPGKQFVPPSRDWLKQAVQDQLGLELAPAREAIEMLVVERSTR